MSRAAAVAAMPAAGLRAWKPMLRALHEALTDSAEAHRDGRETRARLLAHAPQSLLQVAERFGLDEVETTALALCAAAEWDAAISHACAARHGDAARRWPSHALAMALLADADWAALPPDGPARRWRLVDVAPAAGVGEARIAADEHVLQFLAGHAVLDARLDGLVHAWQPAAAADAASEVIAARWRALRSLADCPVIDLSDRPADEARRHAAAACASLGLQLYLLDARDLPAGAAEREALARLWEREALLMNAALMVEGDDAGGPEAAARALQFMDAVQGLVLRGGAAGPRRPRLRCPTPPADDTAIAAWRAALGPAAKRLGARVEAIAAQFRLAEDAIRQAAAQVATVDSPSPDALADALWNACRVQSRGGLDALAQRIEACVGWDDLVLPSAQAATLKTMTLHVHQRHRVHRQWGFDEKGGRGLGIAALFSGASGTGKTLAAEVLAHELQLDLWRVDLSAMMSKYIGETQKNLRTVFDAADSGGAILLFDEADALFAARREARDSVDRHSNMDVAYLLQRIETYRGLAILTTNLKPSIDPAFIRRIRFIVDFPFPDAAARREIWLRAFPERMPREGIDVDRLARLHLAGGNIRALAIGAAFLAADEGVPVRMGHLLRAAQAEYAKLERQLPRNDVEDWL